MRSFIVCGCFTAAFIGSVWLLSNMRTTAEGRTSSEIHVPAGPLSRAAPRPSSAPSQPHHFAARELCDIRRRVGVNILAGSSLDSEPQDGRSWRLTEYGFDEAVRDILPETATDPHQRDGCERGYFQSILADQAEPSFDAALREAVSQLEMKSQQLQQLGLAERSAELRALAGQIREQLNREFAEPANRTAATP